MKKALTAKQTGELLAAIKARFERNPGRHKGVAWNMVKSRLDANPEKLWSLGEMERTGGEPDAVGRDEKSGSVMFVDCAPETPKGRVSLCYDREGWLSRKAARPANTAVDMAAEMGIDILTEAEYRGLQTLGEFDLKTSSWVATPADIRKLGGALFCDRRFGHVFLYHNGAQSYYSVRGFRGMLKV